MNPRRAALAVAVLLVLAVGIGWGWRGALAPLLGLAFLRWALASLRVLTPGATEDAIGPAVEEGPERTVFRCAECGTEVLLLYRGSAKAPSHCGQRMVARTEIVR
jgi:DNA-directed RNA polymerase subunit RPC12/RpoP